MNACPGNCQDAEKIEYMKEQFPMLEFDQLTTKIKEINAIDKRLEQYNKNSLNKDLEDTPLVGWSLFTSPAPFTDNTEEGVLLNAK